MNIVEQINDGIKTRVTTVLGATYSELDYVIDITMNSFRQNSLRYGVRPLSGGSVDGILRHYNALQTFEIILTDDYVNQDDDTVQRSKQFLLFDKHDDILKDILLKKAGVPSIVLSIESFNFPDPEFIDEENVAVQRMQLGVRYRQELTGC